MSSESYTDECPNCGKDMECGKGNSPEDFYGMCMYCGYQYSIISSQMTLEELNAIRREHNEMGYKSLPMLKHLPKMKKKYY